MDHPKIILWGERGKYLSLGFLDHVKSGLLAAKKLNDRHAPDDKTSAFAV